MTTKEERRGERKESFPTERDTVSLAQNHAENTWKKVTAEERELIADTVHYVYALLAKAHFLSVRKAVEDKADEMAKACETCPHLLENKKLYVISDILHRT